MSTYNRKNNKINIQIQLKKGHIIVMLAKPNRRNETQRPMLHDFEMLGTNCAHFKYMD